MSTDLNTNNSFCNLMQSNDAWIQPYPIAITICKDIAEKCATSPKNVTQVGTIPDTTSNDGESFNVYGFYSVNYSSAFSCAEELAPNVTLIYTTFQDYQRVEMENQTLKEEHDQAQDHDAALRMGGEVNWKVGFGLTSLFALGLALQVL